jgi:hypothetical protein
MVLGNRSARPVRVRHHAAMTEYRSAPEPSGQRAVAARLLAAVATELGRRLVGNGSSAWADYGTDYLQSLAGGALAVTVGVQQSVGSCIWDGLPLHPQGNRECCINDHCIPPD